METSLTKEKQRIEGYIEVLEEEIYKLKIGLQTQKDHGDIFNTIKQLERIV